jgi:protein SYS1
MRTVYSAGPFVQTISPKYLFSAAHANTTSFANAMVCVAFLVNAIVSAAAIRIVVARAKKCWDFGSTIYILHLLAVSLWQGFPLRWFWWVLIISCASITVLLSEYLCVRFEMAEIPITLGALRASTLDIMAGGAAS